MNFTVNHSVEILARTPKVLEALLAGLSGDWVFKNEGSDSWSPFDVVGHLIHGEKTDWIPRMNIIFEYGVSKTFDHFDRFAQFEESKGKSLVLLLEEFTRLRQENLRILKNTRLSEADLDRKGRHPAFGEVSLRQLLATWTAHDLSHIAQIARVMARQYRDEIGPWVSYLGIMGQT
jgi:hypothetical protein